MYENRNIDGGQMRRELKNSNWPTLLNAGAKKLVHKYQTLCENSTVSAQGFGFTQGYKRFKVQVYIGVTTVQGTRFSTRFRVQGFCRVYG